MYCEKCGRKLEEGQICPCRKKHKKFRLNKKAIEAFTLLMLGGAVFCYFLLEDNNVLEWIPWKLIQNIKNYLYYAIPAVFFLSGGILGCLSLKKNSRKVLSRFIVIGNFCGILVMAGLAGRIAFQDYQFDRLISGEINAETRTKIMDFYNGANTDSKMKESIVKKLTSELEEIKDTYNKETISYEDAAERLEGIAALSIIQNEVYQKEKELEILKTSKEDFRKAEELESNSETIVEAANLYAAVVPEDQNYEQAQEKYEELHRRFIELAEGENYAENMSILSPFYQTANQDIKNAMEQNACEQAAEMEKDFIKETLTYEAVMEQLSELQKLTGAKETIQSVVDNVDKYQNSKEAFVRAEELAKDNATMTEAIKAYQEVLVDDPNYEIAQSKADTLLKSLAENCVNTAADLVKSFDYPAAIEQIEEGISFFQENEKLISLKTQYTKDYADYALKESDRLIGEEKLDDAKALLSRAYQVTNNPEVGQKLEMVGDYKPVSLCDLISTDSHDVWMEEEEITDSYGNSHLNAYVFNADEGGRAVYQLDGQYENFSGKLVSPDTTSSDAQMSFAIFADDVLVYSVTDYTRQTGEQLIDIDLTDVQRLEFQSGKTEGNAYGGLALVDTNLEKNINAFEPKKEYERLNDTVIIDSGFTELSDRLFSDSYGNLHNGFLELQSDYNAYALFNLDERYANFSGKIVTGSATGSDASITVQIYLDNVLIFEQKAINKSVDAIPFSLNIAGGKVLKIAANETETNGEWNAFGYLVDDKLSFEQLSDVSVEKPIIASNESNVENGKSESNVPVENAGTNITIIEDTSDATSGGNTIVDTSEATMTFNGHTYAMYDMNDLGIASYQALEDYCEAIGGHLAVINSYEENQAIYQYVLSSGKKMAFFGYSDESSEGNWVWADSQENTYTNWAEGQPNNGANNKNGETENYAHFLENGDGTWNDAPFKSNTSMFVCEWEYVETGDASFYNDGTVVLPNSYILADSAQRDLTEADVSRLTHKGIRYAINEIYARNGYTFQLQETAAYFSSQSWYDGGDTSDMETVVSRMNEYERRNNEYLANMEIELYGSQYDLN